MYMDDMCLASRLLLKSSETMPKLRRKGMPSNSSTARICARWCRWWISTCGKQLPQLVNQQSPSSLHRQLLVTSSSVYVCV